MRPGHLTRAAVNAEIGVLVGIRRTAGKRKRQHDHAVVGPWCRLSVAVRGGQRWREGRRAGDAAPAPPAYSRCRRGRRLRPARTVGRCRPMPQRSHVSPRVAPHSGGGEHPVIPLGRAPRERRPRLTRMDQAVILAGALPVLDLRVPAVELGPCASIVWDRRGAARPFGIGQRPEIRLAERRPVIRDGRASASAEASPAQTRNSRSSGRRSR